jgi:type II secretion system protein J
VSGGRGEMSRSSNVAQPPSAVIRHRPGTAGAAVPHFAFTLVEMLVVLLLMSLVTGSALALLRAIAGAREVTENRLDGEQQAMLAMRTITTSLRNVYRPVTADDFLFEGTSLRTDPVPTGRLRFRAIDRRVIRQGQPESDVHELEFFVRSEGRQGVLVRRTDPTENPPPDGGGVIEPIAVGIEGLDVQYLDGSKWEDRWPDRLKRLPAAVSVRLIYRADAVTGRLATISRTVNFPYSKSTGGASGADAPAGTGGSEQ